MTRQQQDYANWCRNLINSLNDGGRWAVPRSGLIFQKRGPHTLVLVNQMPHDPDMPITAEELLEQQETDFRLIRTQFAIAGVSVCRDEG